MKLANLFHVGLGILTAVALVGADRPREGTAVLVVADATPDAGDKYRPTPGNPVYYILRKSELSLGEAVGGIKLPDPALVEREVVAALASQGFVRTDIGGPIPSICILVYWGDANFLDLSARDPDTDPDLQRAMDGARVSRGDRQKIESLVGTDKALSLPTSEAERVLAASNEDRLYLTLCAIDVQALREKKRRLLWRTAMTIDGRKTLAKELPIMLASGAPLFGRDSDVPRFIDDKDRRDARVEIGDLKVVPDAEKAGEGAPVKK